jgi:hypothetical protein
MWSFILPAMASREDKTLKQPEMILTSTTIIPDPGKRTNTMTAKEKISAYFTIAAAAFGLISDGCKSVPLHELFDIARRSGLTMQK